jgi:hypothetical protein
MPIKIGDIVRPRGSSQAMKVTGENNSEGQTSRVTRAFDCTWFASSQDGDVVEKRGSFKEEDLEVVRPLGRRFRLPSWTTFKRAGAIALFGGAIYLGGETASLIGEAKGALHKYENTPVQVDEKNKPKEREGAHGDHDPPPVVVADIPAAIADAGASRKGPPR